MQNTYERPKRKIHVSIDAADGESHKCYLIVNINEQLGDHINGGITFLELENELGQKSYINKSRILSIEPVIEVEEEENVGSSRLAGDKSSQFFSTDPYIILGVHKKAGDEEIKSAYHQLARNYHRDRLAAANLPPEMMIHAEEVLKRINAAYELIVKERKVEAA